MKPKLTYFNIRGRAEPIRLLLTLSGVEFEDCRVPFERWGQMKSTTPFGSLPIYEEGDLKIGQSLAILRYLAGQHGWLPDRLPDRVRCDEVAEATVDLSAGCSRLFWSPHFAEEREPYIRRQLPARLAYLDAHLRKNGRSDCWVGSELYYCDFLAWAALNRVEPLAATLLEQFAALTEFKRTFEARPEVVSYLDHPHRPKTFTFSMAQFGGTPATSGR